MKKIMIFLAFAILLTACSAGTNNVLGGYKVSNISYAFDEADPSKITTVAFDLDNAVATVKVSLVTGGALQPCTSATPFTHWTCTLENVTVINASALRVVATQ